MKRWMMFCGVLFGMFLQVTWGQQQTVSVIEGRAVTVDLPFVVERYDVADRAVLGVNLLAGGRQAALQGLQGGTTTATFSGPDGAARVIEVRVQKDVGVLLDAVRTALEDVPVVDVTRAGDRVLLRGRISSLANWNHVQKVVQAFGDQILNLATLEMPPEVLLGLRNALREAGFRIADVAGDVGDQSPGLLSVGDAGQSVNVAGSVYSQQQLARVREVIASQRHLAIAREGETGSDMIYPVNLNVTVVPLIIEADVAFIAITDEEYSKVGVNLLEAGLMSIDLAGAIVGDVARTRTRESGWTETDGVRTPDTTYRTRDRGRARGSSLSYGVATDISGTLRFFAEDNPQRVLHRGQLHFRNGAEEWRLLHSGGTLMVRLTSERETSMAEIDYGFILKIRGGLKGENQTALEVEFELSTPMQIPQTQDYDLKRDRVSTSLDCTLGHTMVLGGVNSLLDSVDAKETPILRSIPLLRHFFSERTSARTDKRMLILISPHIARDIGKTAPLSDQSIELIEVSEQPSSERGRRRRGRRWFFF